MKTAIAVIWLALVVLPFAMAVLTKDGQYAMWLLGTLPVAGIATLIVMLIFGFMKTSRK